MVEKLVEIRDLKVRFKTYKGVVKAIDIDKLDIYKGETLGLVGETGCGKSVTTEAILNIVPDPGEITNGEIIFEGEDLLKKSKKEWKDIRGKKIAKIFQNPMSNLNPVYRIKRQMVDIIKVHRDIKDKEAEEMALELLDKVRLSNPKAVLNSYPHELSGGMRQRVMIAMALSSNPSLLIADEPTTALDVTIQAQILKLIDNLKEEVGTTVLFITHDLGVIAQVAERVAVMYAGNIVEVADVVDIFENPFHPYTRGLIASIPDKASENEDLPVIKGTVPNLIDIEEGCRFYPRCDYHTPECKESPPRLEEVKEGHEVACFNVDDVIGDDA
ncbi:MAG: ABC transporter ATP-binding protein [Candidatus Saliniplasma sp.]